MQGNYKEYLSSPEWASKKKKVSYWHGKKCLICGNKKVDVHHKTYNKIFKEDVKKDLVPLCRYHHFSIHEESKKSNVNLHNVTNSFIQKSRKKKRYWKDLTNLEKRKILSD